MQTVPWPMVFAMGDGKYAGTTVLYALCLCQLKDNEGGERVTLDRIRGKKEH